MGRRCGHWAIECQGPRADHLTGVLDDSGQQCAMVCFTFQHPERIDTLSRREAAAVNDDLSLTWYPRHLRVAPVDRSRRYPDGIRLRRFHFGASLAGCKKRRVRPLESRTLPQPYHYIYHKTPPIVTALTSRARSPSSVAPIYRTLCGESTNGTNGACPDLANGHLSRGSCRSSRAITHERAEIERCISR
jgi:hypothetical protein